VESAGHFGEDQVDSQGDQLSGCRVSSVESWMQAWLKKTSTYLS
jgi:hypothetical protein